VLLLLLAASSVTYWVLVERSTSRRQWTALDEWGRQHGFRFSKCDPRGLPPPIDALPEPRPRIRICLADRQTTFVQADWTSSGPTGLPDVNPPSVRNLLVRRLPTTWPPTGLRPVSAASQQSILDAFSLSSFPLMGATERFVVFGTDSAAARLLSQSMMRSLLPPDIGLLLHGQELVLDFSPRPFDAIEFDRMLALADQLAQHLPAPNSESR
jgi:hypothetical protein